jgi:hypothetical protein
MMIKKLVRSLLLLLAGSNLAFSNYVEITFQGTIDTVDAGTKRIGDKIEGTFKYEPNAKGTFPGPMVTYPFQMGFEAFPLSMTIDGLSLGHKCRTNIQLVDFSREKTESFMALSSGYLPDRMTLVTLQCILEGPNLFENPSTLPNPPKFKNLSLARFSSSTSVPGNLNSYQKKYSGRLKITSAIAHPKKPEIYLLEVNAYVAVVHFYEKLQYSYDLVTWINHHHMFEQSRSLYIHPFFEGAPRSFFVRTIE